jgi:DNA-binding LacI/PurR family transcriptional regulator
VEILNNIHINPQLDTTLAQQLTQQVTWLIANGKLKPGELLPSVRQLARDLSINLHTVRSAYLKLAADGLVEIHQGKGTRVLPYETQRMAKIANEVRSHTIGVIIPSFTNPFYHPFLQGIESITHQNQTMLFICLTHDDPEEVQRSYAQLAAKNVDGIILASHDDSPFIQPTKRSGVQQPQMLPLVAVDWPESYGYAVLLDLENAGYQATRHLIEHGHHRVGLITFALELPNVHPVNQGYRRALNEAGLVEDERHIARVDGFDAIAGSEGCRALLSLEEPPSAIFAITDLMAIGAMTTAQQAGLKIPQDLAIIGFNNIAMASWVSPPLTTVNAPAYQMGQNAMRMLGRLIAGKRLKRKQIHLPTELVIRQSCGVH